MRVGGTGFISQTISRTGRWQRWKIWTNSSVFCFMTWCGTYFNSRLLYRQADNNIEHLNRSVITHASYSWDPRFKSRPGDRLSWLRVFVAFFSRSK
jgi:hypothetical protein